MARRFKHSNTVQIPTLSPIVRSCRALEFRIDGQPHPRQVTVQCSPLSSGPWLGKKDICSSLSSTGASFPHAPHIPPLCTPCLGLLDPDMNQSHLLSLDELKRGQQLTRWLAAPNQREPGQPGHPFQTGLTDAASHELICTLDQARRKKSQHLPVPGSGWPQSNRQTCIQPPELGAQKGTQESGQPPGAER